MDLTEKTLTAGDVCELTGISANTLRSMTEDGAVRPVANRAGPGNHRLYSVHDAVAVAYGKAWLDIGHGYEWARDMAKAVTNTKLAEFGRAFPHGKTLSVLGHLVKPAQIHHDEGCGGDAFNLEKLFERITRDASRPRPADNGRGRATGLVCNQRRKEK